MPEMDAAPPNRLNLILRNHTCSWHVHIRSIGGESQVTPWKSARKTKPQLLSNYDIYSIVLSDKFRQEQA